MEKKRERKKKYKIYTIYDGNNKMTGKWENTKLNTDIFVKQKVKLFFEGAIAWDMATHSSRPVPPFSYREQKVHLFVDAPGGLWEVLRLAEYTVDSCRKTLEANRLFSRI